MHPSLPLQLVADDYFGPLRQRAQIGRLLGPADNRTSGQHAVAVVSDQYWRFARSARVLDTELTINGQSVAIAGVAAAGAGETGPSSRPRDTHRRAINR